MLSAQCALTMCITRRDPTLSESVVEPDPFDPVSKRRFDGRVKKWRRDLHKFDPNGDAEKREVEDWFLQQQVFLTNVYSLRDFFIVHDSGSVS